MAENSHRITCTGRSMHPTLRQGDTLHVHPYTGKAKPKRGDVVVFVAGDGLQIVHRIVSFHHTGILTKGDNNRDRDSNPLQSHAIRGKVVSLRRGDTTQIIWGGLRGMVQSGLLHLLKKGNRIVSPILHPSYRLLSQKGIFRWLLPERMRPRVLSYRKPHGTEIHLLMGKRIIGRYMPQEGNWHIKRPFRLFVDETSIPSSNRPDEFPH